MNLKYKALGLIAALGLTLLVAAPALADPSAVDSATSDLIVTLDEVGDFAVNIRSAQFNNDVDVDAFFSGATINGEIWIEYTDTKSYRNEFFTKLSATDFESQTVDIPLTSNPYTIPSENLTVTKNFNPAQGRWSSGVGFRIGDIGATSNGAYSTYPCSTGSGVIGPGNVGHHIWTAPNDSLDAARTIACGFDGPGTAADGVIALVTGNELDFGTEHRLEIALDVPGNLAADTYKSVLTVDVAPPGP